MNLKYLSLCSSFVKVIPGNKDSSTLVEYKFKEPFIARTIQIHPLPAHDDPICLRVELYGCDPNPGNFLEA